MPFRPKFSIPGLAGVACCTDIQDAVGQDRNQALQAACAGLHLARHYNRVFRQGTPDCAKLLHVTALKSWGQVCNEAILLLRLPPCDSKIRSSPMLYE